VEGNDKRGDEPKNDRNAALRDSADVDNRHAVQEHLRNFRDEMRHSSDERLRHFRNDVLAEQLIQIDEELASRRARREDDDGDDRGGDKREN
jgi:hypothetical protein